MKKLMVSVVLILFAVSGGKASAQVLSDITSVPEQFGLVIPGIACKTRTNNEASVRNLAHGVYNNTPGDSVALNCGWAVPMPFLASRSEFSDARIGSRIIAGFVRTAGTSPIIANDAFCTVNVSSTIDSNPNPNTAGVSLGAISPSFTAPLGENQNEFSWGASVFSQNVSFPVTFNFISAYCRIPLGVRLQLFLHDANGVEEFLVDSAI